MGIPGGAGLLSCCNGLLRERVRCHKRRFDPATSLTTDFRPRPGRDGAGCWVGSENRGCNRGSPISM